MVVVHDLPSPEVYTLSLHDALPISASAIDTSRKTTTCSASSTRVAGSSGAPPPTATTPRWSRSAAATASRSSSRKRRSEEHTSELQSQFHLVCRLLLENKNLIWDGE